MRSSSYNIFLLVFCFILFTFLLPAAYAEEGSRVVYDNSIITGFEPADHEKTIDIEYKYALIELEKEFPSQLEVRFGGEAVYQEDGNGGRILSDVTNYTSRTIDVRWECLEDYDEKLDVFHFVPNLEGYKTAAGLVLPAITVNVLGEFQAPPMPPLPVIEHEPVPILSNNITEKAILPDYYNNYERGVLPPIRNQNTDGTCWAFASIAAVEADLIHDGKADTNIDFSELHLVYFTKHNFYDEKNCNTGDTVSLKESNYLTGNNPGVAALYLANMIGPVKEEYVPYSYAANYSPEEISGRTGSAQVTGVYQYDPKADRESVKHAIMEHGAVIVSYYDDNLEGNNNYSASNNSYYQPNSHSTNHAVALVGWNDNFSAGKFKSGTPEGNGAWLVRNSWGKNRNDHGGYFWLSYYDKSLSNICYAIDAQPWRYDHVYSYANCPAAYALDPFEWDVFSSSSDEVTVSQKYHVDGGEEVQALGFYTEDSYLGLRFTVSSGGSKVTQSLSVTAPGYYLVHLSKPLTIRRSSDVTVEYTFTRGLKKRPFVESGSLSLMKNKEIVLSYHGETGGGGSIVNGDNVGRDAAIKLFTGNIPDLVLPENLTAIRSEAFSGTKFKYAKLSEKTVSIGYLAFDQSPTLRTVYIPSSTTSIDPMAFGNKIYLTIIGVPGSYAETYAKSHGYAFRPVN